MIRKFLLLCLVAAGPGLWGCGSVKHVGCHTHDPAASLDWLRNIIAEMEKAPSDNDKAEITQHTYYNRTVFYVVNRCCDRPNELYDCDGNKICEPDGGITGKGDGRCADFFEKREGSLLIWPNKQRKFAP